MADLNKDGIIVVRDVTELQKIFQNKNILIACFHYILSAFYRIIDITKYRLALKLQVGILFLNINLINCFYNHKRLSSASPTLSLFCVSMARITL